MLEKEYKDDPVLLNFYQKRLLIPLWVGEVTDAEAEYIAEELTRNPELRRRWQKAYGVKRRYRKVTPAMVIGWCEKIPESHIAT